MAGKVADLAVQVHGGTGYMRGVAVERIDGDVRLLRLYEGTSEIQRLIIGGGLGKAAQRATRPASVPVEVTAAVHPERALMLARRSPPPLFLRLAMTRSITPLTRGEQSVLLGIQQCLGIGQHADIGGEVFGAET